MKLFPLASAVFSGPPIGCAKVDHLLHISQRLCAVRLSAAIVRLTFDAMISNRHCSQ